MKSKPVLPVNGYVVTRRVHNESIMKEAQRDVARGSFPDTLTQYEPLVGIISCSHAHDRSPVEENTW
jgi:hypothetical protein